MEKSNQISVDSIIGHEYHEYIKYSHINGMIELEEKIKNSIDRNRFHEFLIKEWNRDEIYKTPLKYGHKRSENKYIIDIVNSLYKWSLKGDGNKRKQVSDKIIDNIHVDDHYLIKHFKKMEIHDKETTMEILDYILKFDMHKTLDELIDYMINEHIIYKTHPDKNCYFSCEMSESNFELLQKIITNKSWNCLKWFLSKGFNLFNICRDMMLYYMRNEYYNIESNLDNLLFAIEDNIQFIKRDANKIMSLIFFVQKYYHDYAIKTLLPCIKKHKLKFDFINNTEYLINCISLVKTDFLLWMIKEDILSIDKDIIYTLISSRELTLEQMNILIDHKIMFEMKCNEKRDIIDRICKRALIKNVNIIFCKRRYLMNKENIMECYERFSDAGIPSSYEILESYDYDFDINRLFLRFNLNQTSFRKLKRLHKIRPYLFENIKSDLMMRFFSDCYYSLTKRMSIDERKLKIFWNIFELLYDYMDLKHENKRSQNFMKDVYVSENKYSISRLMEFEYFEKDISHKRLTGNFIDNLGDKTTVEFLKSRMVIEAKVIFTILKLCKMKLLRFRIKRKNSLCDLEFKIFIKVASSMSDENIEYLIYLLFDDIEKKHIEKSPVIEIAKKKIQKFFFS